MNSCKAAGMALQLFLFSFFKASALCGVLSRFSYVSSNGQSFCRTQRDRVAAQFQAYQAL